MGNARHNTSDDGQLPGVLLQQTPHQQKEAKVDKVKEQLHLEESGLEDKEGECRNQQQSQHC